MFCGWSANTCPAQFCGVYFATSNTEALYQRMWKSRIKPLCDIGHKELSEYVNSVKLSVCSRDVESWKYSQNGLHHHLCAVKLVEALLRLSSSKFVDDFDLKDIVRFSDLGNLCGQKSIIEAFSGVSAVCSTAGENEAGDASAASSMNQFPNCDVISLQRFCKAVLLGIFGWEIPCSEVVSTTLGPCRLSCSICSRSVALNRRVVDGESVQLGMMFEHKNCCPFVHSSNTWSNITETETETETTTTADIPGWLVYVHLLLDHMN